MLNKKELIQTEEQRLVDTITAAKKYIYAREKALGIHDSELNRLKTERIESVSWREKNDINEKLVEHNQYDPRKYLIPYESIDAPYFAVFQIHDNDKKIRTKEYCLGQQALTVDSKAVVLDWRAEVAKLYYEYDENEEYEDEIQKRDRSGKLGFKNKVTIQKKYLLRIETSHGTFEFHDGTWKIGKEIITSSDRKLSAEDHHLTDIIALISPDQFKEISRTHHGCIYLTGSAGSGKTTVALHHLSYQQFNNAKRFTPERCMVVMFNRTLREYVKKSSEKLLGTTRIETFNSWVLSALQSFSIRGIQIIQEAFEVEKIKRSITAEQISAYVNSTTSITETCELWKLYTQLKNPDASSEIAKLIADSDVKLQHKSKEMSFVDLTILLRILQLRAGTETVHMANNYFAHLVIDEAQDFGFLELDALYSACDASKSMMICADSKQRILDFVDASGFPKFQQMVLTNKSERSNLTISYRSAKKISKLAGILRNQQVQSSNQKEGIIESFELPEISKAYSKLFEVTKAKLEAEPRAIIGVICKKKTDIPKLLAVLKEVKARNISECDFQPGVIVANAHQVKGLEFTHVIVWNPAEKAYRKSEVDQNLLYVAITRACDTLTCIAYEPLSETLRSAIKNCS